VPVETEWIVVETDGADPVSLTQQARRDDREDSVVGTTGGAVRPIEPEAEPPAAHPEAEPRPMTRPLSALSPASVEAATTTNTPIHGAPAPDEVVAPPAEPDQRERVRELLQRYVAAFEGLDADAAKAVWPTVDDEALRRAFSQLQAQHLTFESCGITIAGPDANARCRGQATFHPRVGSRPLRLSSREWTFQLARAESGWQIVDATVR
jgi:hypothetical protein